MRDFRTEQARNAWKLRGFLVAYFALALFAGRFLGVALEDDPYTEAPAPPLFSFAYPNRLALAFLVLAWVQYRRALRQGGGAILALAGARPLREQRFRNTGAEMALAAGAPAPRMFVIEDDSLNAFACGTPKESAAIAVTRGLLERLDRDELQAVVAHETAHIVNGDTKLMTLLFGMAQSFRLAAAVAIGPLAALWWCSRGGGDDETPPERAAPAKDLTGRQFLWLLAGMPLIVAGLLVVSLVVSVALTAGFWFLLRFLPWIVLAYALFDLFFEPRAGGSRGIVANLCLLAPCGLILGPAILVLGLLVPGCLVLLRLAVSRNREYQADATAVELTRNPEALMRALQRLLHAGPTKLKPALSPLTIAPLRRRFPLLSTHPPLEERIRRVAAMCQRDPAPERILIARV